MGTMQPAKLALYTILKTFREISETDIDIISKHAQSRNIKAGHILLEQGDTARELYFIVSGIIKITSVNAKGNVVVLFFIKENKFSTILNSLSKGIASHENIVAATDAELLVFSKHNLLKIYEQLPYFEELLDNIMRQGLLEKIQLRNQYMGEEATTRYHRFMSLQPDILLRVSLSDVASYLNITQQSLSRIRKNI